MREAASPLLKMALSMLQEIHVLRARELLHTAAMSEGKMFDDYKFDMQTKEWIKEDIDAR